MENKYYVILSMCTLTMCAQAVPHGVSNNYDFLTILMLCGVGLVIGFFLGLVVCILVYLWDFLASFLLRKRQPQQKP